MSKRIASGLSDEQVLAEVDARFVSVEEAAHLLGLKPATIRSYLTHKRLTSRTLKTATLISKHAITDFRQSSRR